MAEGTIYTRVYSERSAGKLSSGKKPTGNALTHAELLDEFRKHADLRNREPTALISVSSRIIDTIQRAFKKCYAYDELPEDIWIAFIKAPATGHESPTSLHVAQHLAEECELETPGIFRDEDKTPGIFRYEYIFEWVIPDKYVLHQVSLKTLMDRGLDWEKYVFADDRYRKVVSTEKLRERVAVALLPQQAWRDPWGVGICLALFAQKFGARAPLDWVAHQLFYDCVRTEVIENDDVVVEDYGHDSLNMVNFDFFSELDGGIDTVLYEWWLTDTEFCLDLNEFEEWRAGEEHGKHEKIWQAIEARAVAVGL